VEDYQDSEADHDPSYTNDDDDFDPNQLADDMPTKKKTKTTQPAFYDRTIASSERAAIRSRVANSDTLLLLEGPEALLNDAASTKTVSRVPGKFGRRDRSPGTDALSSYSKKITANLDSDDELIMNMRDKGFSDAQISDRLAKEGRVRYDRKSISTRIGRIKVAQGELVDQLLADRYKEWDMADDLKLMQAYELADIEVRYEIERVRAWRFKKVSDYMRRLDKNSIFSAKACKERYQTIMDGTVEVPTDQWPDPAARRAEVDKEKKEKEVARQKEKAEQNKIEAEQRKIREEVRLRQIEKSAQTARIRGEKAQKKAERDMQRATQSQIKAARATENRVSKDQKAEQIRAQKAAEVQRNREKNPHEAVNLNLTSELKNVKDKPDPRSYLSLEDLATLCRQRSLDSNGRRKEQLVQRLRHADDVWTLAQLKTMCRTKGLNCAATKVVLRYQLALAEAKKFDSFAVGFAAAREAGADDDDDEDGVTE
jgi:hypothetical protein